MFFAHSHKPPRFHIKHAVFMALVPLIAVVGFLFMYLFGYVVPLGSDWSAGLAMFLFIVVGLAVPYVMVKIGVHESAYVSHQPEKDLNFSDIPKDKENLWGEKDDNFKNPS